MGLNLYASLARMLIKQGLEEAKEHFAACEVADCSKHSIGSKCASCGRFACVEHVFLPVSLPVRFLCAECIQRQHVAAKPRRKRREKAE